MNLIFHNSQNSNSFPSHQHNSYFFCFVGVGNCTKRNFHSFFRIIKQIPPPSSPPTPPSTPACSACCTPVLQGVWLVSFLLGWFSCYQVFMCLSFAVWLGWDSHPSHCHKHTDSPPLTTPYRLLLPSFTIPPPAGHKCSHWGLAVFSGGSAGVFFLNGSTQCTPRLILSELMYALAQTNTVSFV